MIHDYVCVCSVTSDSLQLPGLSLLVSSAHGIFQTKILEQVFQTWKTSLWRQLSKLFFLQSMQEDFLSQSFHFNNRIQTIQIYYWVAQLVKNLPAMQENPILFLGQEVPPEKGEATHSSIPRLLGGSDGKESICNAADLGWIPGLGRSPGGEHGNLFQYSCLEETHGQRSLVGYSPWCRQELDRTE